MRLATRFAFAALAVALLVTPIGAQADKGAAADSRLGPPVAYTPFVAPAVAASACITPSQAIPDATPAGVDLVIDTTAESGTINDLNLYVDTVHTWVGDLIFTLSNGTTTITVIDRPGSPAISGFGCSGEDILATLDDEGATAVEDECAVAVPTINGTFIGGDPANPALFAAFDGQPFNDTWTINVSDHAAADLGTVRELCLVADVTLPVPTLPGALLPVVLVLLVGATAWSLRHARVRAA